MIYETKLFYFFKIFILLCDCFNAGCWLITVDCYTLDLNKGR